MANPKPLTINWTLAHLKWPCPYFTGIVWSWVFSWWMRVVMNGSRRCTSTILDAAYFLLTFPLFDLDWEALRRWSYQIPSYLLCWKLWQQSTASVCNKDEHWQCAVPKSLLGDASASVSYHRDLTTTRHVSGQCHRSQHGQRRKKHTRDGWKSVVVQSKHSRTLPRPLLPGEGGNRLKRDISDMYSCQMQL